MNANTRRAIRGRVAIVVLVCLTLAVLLAFQQATLPEPIDGSIHWRLETLSGQSVHINFDVVQRQAEAL